MVPVILCGLNLLKHHCRRGAWRARPLPGLTGPLGCSPGWSPVSLMVSGPPALCPHIPLVSAFHAEMRQDLKGGLLMASRPMVRGRMEAPVSTWVFRLQTPHVVPTAHQPPSRDRVFFKSICPSPPVPARHCDTMTLVTVVLSPVVALLS